MKYFAILAAVLGVAMALPTSSVWTLQQLSDALENPHTDQTQVPYLEQALNTLMASIFSGSDVNAIWVEFPEGKPTPTLPEIVPTPSASSGPLVQLIINVNNKNEVVAPEAPASPVAPEVVPTPVQVVDSPEYEDVIVGPVIVESPEVISNPVDIMNPVPAPVIDGDFGVIV